MLHPERLLIWQKGVVMYAIAFFAENSTGKTEQSVTVSAAACATEVLPALWWFWLVTQGCCHSEDKLDWRIRCLQYFCAGVKLGSSTRLLCLAIRADNVVPQCLAVFCAQTHVAESRFSSLYRASPR